LVIIIAFEEFSSLFEAEKLMKHLEKNGMLITTPSFFQIPCVIFSNPVILGGYLPNTHQVLSQGKKLKNKKNHQLFMLCKAHWGGHLLQPGPHLTKLLLVTPLFE
jgi:hypothetical protein